MYAPWPISLSKARTLWGHHLGWYDKGHRLLVHDYEKPNRNAVSGTAPAPPRRSPSPGNPSPRVLTEDLAKAVRRQITAATRKRAQQLGVELETLVSQLSSPETSTDELIRSFGSDPVLGAEEKEEGERLAAQLEAEASAQVKPDSASLNRVATGAEPRIPDSATRAMTELFLKARSLSPAADTARPLSRLELQVVLHRLLQKKKELTARSAAAAEGLLQEGVLASTYGQNIFQIAHRNYRGFGKWRSGERAVAMNPAF